VLLIYLTKNCHRIEDIVFSTGSGFVWYSNLGGYLEANENSCSGFFVVAIANLSYLAAVFGSISCLGFED
jgi:hypothetical protein